MPEVPDPKAIWNARFSSALEARRQAERGSDAGEPIIHETDGRWLDRWLNLLRTTGTTPVLDLGCGNGGDARYLVAHGLPVLLTDFSRPALELARSALHPASASAVELDLRDGLPFRRAAFRVIIANLSLHYHRWSDTQRILEEVRQRLQQPGGMLIARVNSIDDVLHGAGSPHEIERHCYLVAGEVKRFFDREDLEALFAEGWHIQSLETYITHCYAKPKAVWEIIAHRAPAP